MTWDDYKFHPSSLGKVMTDSRTKEPLGETCLKHLMECWVERRYKRKKDITNKYIEKGKAVEEDGITLYSRVTKTFYKKNQETIENGFLIGTPDLYLGDSIQTATVVKDIKCSWDIYTFYNNLLASTKKQYFWQLQGYMDLTGATKAGLVYTLIDTPIQMIEQEKYWLSRRMGVIDPEMNPEYQRMAADLEKSLTFSDIPIQERYIEIEIERDQNAINQAHARIHECRHFLNKLKQHP